MVGRLVEHEQVGVVDEQARERDAAPLAAGHRADDGVEPVVYADGVDAAEQAVEDVADARVAGPLVLGAVADHDVAQGRRGVEVVALREHADRQAAVRGSRGRSRPARGR